jgi:hypothetical protein
MIPVELIPDMWGGEIKDNSGYIIKIFVNTTTYPHTAQQ